jgi:hypothetical protein
MKTQQVSLLFASCIMFVSIKKLRGFSPLANYTDRAIAAGQPFQKYTMLRL